MTPEQLQAGLLALERLRGELDDAVLDLAQTALRDRLALLRDWLELLRDRLELLRSGWNCCAAVTRPSSGCAR